MEALEQPGIHETKEYRDSSLGADNTSEELS